MAITVFPVDNAPSYTGRHLRQPLSVLSGGGTPSRPLGGFSAIRQGSGTVVTATSTTWTITPHAGQLDLEASASASVYLYAIEDSTNTGNVTAADASNPRVDIVYLTLNDPSEGDGTGSPALVAGYLAGTPGATPSAPTTPARSMVLAQINVPKSGGGSPTVTMVAPEVSAGGTLSVRSQAQRDALTAFDGLRVYRLDTHTTEIYGPSGWQGRVFLAAGAGPDGGFSVSSPPIPSAAAPASFWRDSAGVVHGSGMFGYTTGQASVSSRSIGSIIPSSMTAQTARGTLSFMVRFHAGTFYGTGILQIDPQANTATISKADGTTFSWGGNDNWVSLDGVHWDAT